MTKELEEISNMLLSIYQKNLSFLKENFFSVYQQIENLSVKINDKKIKEKYTLELINGYFDILNHENNGFFYHTNSYEDADKRSDTVDFSTNSSLELLRKNPYTKKLLSTSLYKDAMPIIDHINENIDLENIEYQKIYKFIFIGTGLGFHIQEINKKINPYTTLIIEPELEIFRLSLFVTDYTVFNEGNKKLFLSIGDDSLNRALDFQKFSKYHEYMNFNVKYYNLLESTKYIKNEIIDFFGKNSETSFPYKVIVENLEKTVSFIKRKDRFLSAPLTKEHKILKGKKVLHISAGPSLDNYIEWIKENQNKFIIISVDVIVKKLEKHGIIPNIVVSIDPSHLCAKYLTTEDPDFLKNTAIILLSQQDPSVFEVINDKHYYFSQVLPIVKEIGYFGSTPNVGTYSFEIGIFLGAEEIYLIGNDAAFNQETGNRYAADSAFKRSDKLESQIKEDYSDDQVVEVKGNLRKKIKSNKGLLGFKVDYEHSILRTNKLFKYKAYNLSDGAYIEGLIPMTKDELSNIIKEISSDKIHIIKEVDKISTVVDSLEYEEDIKIFNNIINRVKKFQKKELKSKDNFLEEKLELMIWILEKTKDKSNNVFANIFLRYTALIDIYINFYLNIKQDNIHTKEELNKISKLWAQGVITLFKDMKKAIS